MYPDEWSAEWFWTTALIYFMQKGPDSQDVLQRLKDAIDQNPHVLTFLSSTEYLPPGSSSLFLLTFKR
jgi:hypothetical protein